MGNMLCTQPFDNFLAFSELFTVSSRCIFHIYLTPQEYTYVSFDSKSDSRHLPPKGDSMFLMVRCSRQNTFIMVDVQDRTHLLLLYFKRVIVIYCDNI